jgi:hypothetical protein
MAQTRKRRRRKHRGTQGGGIDRRGPRGRPRTRAEAQARARSKRKPGVDRRNLAPTWQSAFNRAALGAALFFALAIFLLKQTVAEALAVSVLLMAFYVPLGYYVDRFLWRRRIAKERAARAARANQN